MSCSAILLLVSLLAVVFDAQGVIVPLNDTVLTPAIMSSACQGQGTRNVCDPFSRPNKYVECSSSPALKTCPSGRAFDYVDRKCKSKRLHSLKVCPKYQCPVGSSDALVALGPPFGVAGNVTIPLVNKTSFHLFCSVNGHCLGGMMVPVTVDCPAPPDRVPYTFDIPWYEPMQNNISYPHHLASIAAYCGDSLYVHWEEPVHLVVMYNTDAKNRAEWSGLMNMPYPPQPVYECPMWINGSAPNETAIIPLGLGPKFANWTETKPTEYYLACPARDHCRQGMVFKVTVLAAPMGYAPVTRNILWVLTSLQYPDMTVYVGDTISIGWPSPFNLHGLSRFPDIPEL